jgi:hypothetical protein
LQEKGLSNQHEDSLARKGEDRGSQDRHGEKRFACMSISFADSDMRLGSEMQKGRRILCRPFCNTVVCGL